MADEYVSKRAVCYQLDKRATIDGQPRAIRRAMRIVQEFPSADVVTWEELQKTWKIANHDVQPVRHGRWNRKEYNPHESRDACSQCGAIFDRPTDSEHWLFCPNCGAKNDGGDSNER